MAISIDWGTRVIFVPRNDMTLIQLAPTEIRELNLNAFRLELKSLEDDEEGMPHPDTHQHNTEVDVGGLTLARVIEMINGYTITFEDGLYAVNLTGANSNVGDVINVNQVSIRSNNSAGLISSPDIEYSSFNGGVHVDVYSIYDGTVFPTGTPRQKVNNLDDALLIAQYRGFDVIYLHSPLTIGAGHDLTDFTLCGGSFRDNVVTIDAAAIVVNAAIKNCVIQGTLDGNIEIEDCTVLDLTYVNGLVKHCGLAGTISLDGADDATFVDCYTIYEGSLCTIDMGGTGQSLAMPNYSGIIVLQNLTVSAAPPGFPDVGIGLNAGSVIIMPTVSAGELFISGIGNIQDYSTGTAVVDISTLLNVESCSLTPEQQAQLDGIEAKTDHIQDTDVVATRKDIIVYSGK